MIDFEQWARALEEQTAGVAPETARAEMNKALRHLATDVLNEAAKDLEAATKNVDDGGGWHVVKPLKGRLQCALFIRSKAAEFLKASSK